MPSCPALLRAVFCAVRTAASYMRLAPIPPFLARERHSRQGVSFASGGAAVLSAPLATVSQEQWHRRIATVLHSRARMRQ